MLRWLPRIVLAALLSGVAAFLWFYLPSREVVRITGVSVKYMDSTGWFDSEVSSSAVAVDSRDVRFINAVRPDNDIRIFRNENTDWGFPWYFKFDAGELEGQAQKYALAPADQPAWVVVTHYGVRFTLLAMYPNAISMRPAEGPDELLIPWFNIAFLLVLGALVLWVYWRIRRFKEDRIDPVIDRIDLHLDDAAAAVDSRADALAGRATTLGGRVSRWLASWRPKDRRR